MSEEPAAGSKDKNDTDLTILSDEPPKDQANDDENGEPLSKKQRLMNNKERRKQKKGQNKVRVN